MKQPREITDYMKDMLDYAEKALQLTQQMDFHAFSRDERTHLAVIRCLEVIGGSSQEGARKLPKAP